MPLAGFESSIPVHGQLQKYLADRAATGLGTCNVIACLSEARVASEEYHTVTRTLCVVF
jgi:hypothetical protein